MEGLQLLVAILGAALGVWLPVADLLGSAFKAGARQASLELLDRRHKEHSSQINLPQ